jgi:hypothetical protein
VTADVDFIGDSALAKELGQELGWRTWIPSLDDATSQTGKVTKRVQDGVKQVDFLSGVVGLTTKDIIRRAAELDVPSVGVVRVLHPVDVLDSRIQNLHLLPEKRNPAGIAQARLAIDVGRAFVQKVAAEDERAGLKLLERIADIARDIAGVQVFLLFGLDPLDAVPIESFRMSPKLHELRWPEIQGELARKRNAMRKLMQRRKARS